MFLASKGGEGRPIRLQDFPAHVEHLHGNNDYLFSTEFSVSDDYSTVQS